MTAAELELEAGVSHEADESVLSLFSENGSKSVVSQLLDHIHSHEKSSERRGGGFSERFLRWRRRYLPVAGGDNRRDHHGSVKHSGPLVSGAAYCISSCSMILMNKVVLSTYNFNAGISLMLYQNLISCLVVALLKFSGVVSVEKFNWKLIRVWLPVNVIFVGMLISGMYSLKYINVAMVTILKNATNIITAIGELYMFRKRQNNKVWAAMFMMIISAISGGITDLTFNAVGYMWQTANCVLTASYSLTLRRVMDKAKQSTKSGSLNEVSMVLLNNLLSLPFGIFLIILLGEWRYVISTDVTKDAMFWVVATASGFLGLAISFTSMWFLHQTGPTTYSLPNLFSILFGLFAGVVFARAKMS
ncbi:hypothetical protein N665_0020s0145 [Sinapis alba]|nr:hypothetical protein N665_0020s0145 [Sinapis alba]